MWSVDEDPMLSGSDGVGRPGTTPELLKFDTQFQSCRPVVDQVVLWGYHALSKAGPVQKPCVGIRKMGGERVTSYVNGDGLQDTLCIFETASIELSQTTNHIGFWKPRTYCVV